MITSRRSFIAGIAAAFAAPAIVKASSLMPVRSIDRITMRAITDYYDVYNDEVISRLDIVYGRLVVRPEWLGLDEFTDRIMEPMIKRFQQSVVDEIMNQSMLDKNESFMEGSQWSSKLTYNKELRTIVRTIIPVREVFNVA